MRRCLNFAPWSIINQHTKPYIEGEGITLDLTLDFGKHSKSHFGSHFWFL